MTLTFSFAGNPERIAAEEVDKRVPDGVNPWEVIRIRSQLRLVECPAHHRKPRAIHVEMVGTAAPGVSAVHDCAADDAACQALDAEVRRLISPPQL